jgi:hypothetical protein
MSDLDDMGHDKVWLVFGPDYNDGEIISRMRLPEDATRTALTLDGGVLAKVFKIEGVEERPYEVFTVER